MSVENGTTAQQELDSIMHVVGGLIEDTADDWARVGMGCLDQAGLSVAVQDEITAILRRVGVDLRKAVV